MWHVSSCSGVEPCKLLYTCLTYSLHGPEVKILYTVLAIGSVFLAHRGQLSMISVIL